MKKIIFISLINLLIVNSLQAQTPNIEIWEIQGNNTFTPYLNQTVETTQNVVTAVGDDFFFIQTPDHRADADNSTSNGIKILTNGNPTVQKGNLISIIGTVRESFQRTQIDESDGLTITVDSINVSLPTPVMLTENFPSENSGSFPDLEKVEGMLVQFPQAITTAPTNQYGETPIKIGTKRSFREPGILAPAPSGLPEWDGNPEILDFDPNGLGLPNQNNLSARLNISATGVIDYAFEDYILLASDYEITGQPPFQGVDVPLSTQATIGSINCLVFSNLENEYPTRRQKLANYIVDLMQAPDIVAVQEVRSLFVLQDLADFIQTNHPNIIYTPHLISSGSTGSFIIEVGYLVKNTVSDVQVTQLGADENLSVGGSLHYRPPLLLEGNFNTNPPQSIKVLNLHLKSLGGSSSTKWIRRHEQGISVANMVEARINENLVVVGDFNAFQFSDGKVDIVNQIAGTPSLGAEFPVQNIVSIPLTNQSLSVPEEEQYSYVFQNNAQILDHCLTTDFQGLTVNKLQYVRANSDFSEDYFSTNSPNYYTSDHDGFVLFVDLESELSVNNQDLVKDDFKVKYPNPFSQNQQITFELQQSDYIHISLANLEGKIVFEKNIGQLSKGQYFQTIPLQIPSGAYFLNIKGEKNNFTGKLIYKK